MERLFRGFFAEGRDRETLLRLAEKARVERVGLGKALDRGAYLPPLGANDRRQKELHLEGVPPSCGEGDSSWRGPRPGPSRSSGGLPVPPSPGAD